MKNKFIYLLLLFMFGYKKKNCINKRTKRIHVGTTYRESFQYTTKISLKMHGVCKEIKEENYIL